MKLTTLTPEQEVSLSTQRDKWLKIGLSTDPLDFEAAKTYATQAYEVAGLEAPTQFYRFQSPLSAAIGATMLRGDHVRASVRASVRDSVGASVGDSVWDSVWDSVGASVRASVWDSVGDSVGDQVYGAHDAHWLGFYETFANFGIADAEKLRPLMNLATVCGWWAPYRHCAIFQDRPKLIKFDDRNRLHCEDGPAIRYRDGFSVFSWHGTRIPGEWIENPLPAHEALRVDNMEQRRAACEIVGWNQILKELNARSIDKHDNPFVGELLEVEIPDIGREKFLRVKCGTDREFALPVPPEMQRASQAQAWLNFTTEDMYLPELRT